MTFWDSGRHKGLPLRCRSLGKQFESMSYLVKLRRDHVSENLRPTPSPHRLIQALLLSLSFSSSRDEGNMEPMKMTERAGKPKGAFPSVPSLPFVAYSLLIPLL